MLRSAAGFVIRGVLDTIGLVLTFLVITLPGWVDDLRSKDEYVAVKTEWIIR
jgi:hypothetical protein